MADLATQSANPVANKPTSTIGGNAPPTPPETQEVKSANPATTLPASADEATKANETSSVPVPASTSETEPSKALGETETTAPVNGVTAESGTGTDSVKAAEAQADQLAAQPEKPSDNLSSAPINAEPSAAAATPANEELSKEPPKPVSLEEVSDPEGPATKLKAAEDVVKPDAAKAPEAAPVPEEKKDAEMTEEQPAVTTGPSAPEAVPAVSEPVAEEPKTGQKRKAEEPAAAAPAVNGNKTAEQQASPEKKQKVSPIKKVAEKVTNTVKKVGRPKKEKKEPAPVGKTARKTRSQGKADE